MGQQRRQRHRAPGADAVAASLRTIGGSEAMQAASDVVYACDHLNKPHDVIAKAFGEKQHECRRIEQDIVDHFVTFALVDKTMEKIRLQEGSFSAKCIPKLLGTVWHEFVVENAWEMTKKFKNPTVDFKTLNQLCILKVKEHKKELFGLGG